jgi:hypothetical protein
MSRPDIVGDALALIKPKPEQEAACATTIRGRIALLRKVSAILGASPSPRDLRNDLGEISDHLKRTKQLLERSKYAGGLLWKTRGGADSVDEHGFPRNLPAKALLDEINSSTKLEPSAAA